MHHYEPHLHGSTLMIGRGNNNNFINTSLFNFSFSKNLSKTLGVSQMPSRNKVSKLVKSVKSCIAKDNWENFQELISKLKKTGGQDELFDNGYLSAEKKPTKCC